MRLEAGPQRGKEDGPRLQLPSTINELVPADDVDHQNFCEDPRKVVVRSETVRLRHVLPVDDQSRPIPPGSPR